MLSQIQKKILKKYEEAFNKGDETLASITSVEEWEEIKKEMIGKRKSIFLEETYKEYDLNPRIVSEHIFKDFKIQNILLNSPIGIEVCTTVFSPIKEGKYPGILKMTGSSSKLKTHYWSAAQNFAKNGYVVISCEQLGFVSERREKNDAFYEQPLGYLVGYNSLNSYYSDIIACLDYLDTREDVLNELGYGATGVSLGGYLSVDAAMLEDRIKIFAPVCCSMDIAPYIQKSYTISPLQYYKGSYRDGVDYSFRVALCAPKPCIILNGVGDEICSLDLFKSTSKKISGIYNIYGEGIFEEYVDYKTGHYFSQNIANRIVHKFNKFFKGIDFLPTNEEVDNIEEEQMKSYPDLSINSFSLSKNISIELEKTRKKLPLEDLRTKAIELLNMDEIIKVEKEILGEKEIIWRHDFERFNILINEKEKIPAIYINRDNKKRPGVIVVDEKGMWNEIYQQKMTCQRARILNRVEDENEPCVLSIDASSYGENSLKRVFFDAVEWSNTKRNLAYLGFGLNKPLMGYITRDILAAIKYMKALDNIDENRITIIGIGECAIAALHAALIEGNIEKVEIKDMINAYSDFFSKYPEKLPQEIIIPDILKYYDLPYLIERLSETTNIKFL